MRSYLTTCCFVLSAAMPLRAADLDAMGDFIKVPRGVAYFPDVTYSHLDDADKTPLALDIAYPTRCSGPHPVLVYFHGGGWLLGSRKKLTPYILQAAQNGYVAVTVSYRLGEPFPGAVEDAKCAIRWLRANAAQYHLDKVRIGAVGYSAGGQLACLLGSTGDASSRVQAVACWYGITNLENLVSTQNFRLTVALRSYLPGADEAKKAAAKAASPITYTSKETAPTLLIHGVNDTLIPIEQSRSYAEKLKTAGA